METTKLELAEMLANGSKIAVEGKIYDERPPKNIISPPEYTGKPYNFWAQKIKIKDKEGHTLSCDVSFYHEADALKIGQTVVLNGVMGSWTGKDGTEHKDLQKAKVIEFITDVNDDMEEEDDVPDSPPIVGEGRKPLKRREGSEGYVDDDFPAGSTKEKPMPASQSGLVVTKPKVIQKENVPTKAQIAKAKMGAFEKKEADAKVWLDKDERISRCVALEHGCGLIKEGKLSLSTLKKFIDEFICSSFHRECEYKVIEKSKKE